MKSSLDILICIWLLSVELERELALRGTSSLLGGLPCNAKADLHSSPLHCSQLKLLSLGEISGLSSLLLLCFFSAGWLLCELPPPLPLRVY
jgi:hypothetical protein